MPQTRHYGLAIQVAAREAERFGLAVAGSPPTATPAQINALTGAGCYVNRYVEGGFHPVSAPVQASC